MRKFKRYVQYLVAVVMFLLIAVWAYHLPWHKDFRFSYLVPAYYAGLSSLGLDDHGFGLIGPWLLIWSLFTTIWSFAPRSK